MQAHQGFNKQSIISHLHCVRELPSPGHRQQLSTRWYLGHFAQEFARPCLPPSTSCRSSSFSNSHWCSRMRLSPRGRQPAKFSSPRTYATEVSKIFLLLRCMPERKPLFFFPTEKPKSNFSSKGINNLYIWHTRTVESQDTWGIIDKNVSLLLQSNCLNFF